MSESLKVIAQMLNDLRALQAKICRGSASA